MQCVNLSYGHTKLVRQEQLRQHNTRPQLASKSLQRYTRLTQVQAKQAQEKKSLVADDITEGEWKEKVLESPVPVLVDFWAPWCGPCRIIMPHIDAMQGEYGEKARVYKVNTDDQPGIATEYGIRSIPTVMIFKDGVKQETIIGAVPKQTLTENLNKYLD